MYPSAALQASSIGRICSRRPGLALVLGALLVSAFSTLWLLLQVPDFLSGYDFVRMHVFYKSYFRDAILAGRLPLWNPYVGLGRPFLADIETATLYPPTFLVLPLGVAGGVVASVFLHQALAVYGGVRLARLLGSAPLASWLLGIGFALGSPVAGRLETGMLEAYYSLCWWPLLLELGCRLQDNWNPRVAASFSLVLGLSILAGNPPIFYVELVGLMVLLLFRQDWPRDMASLRASLRRLAGFVASGLAGVALAGIQVVPFLELVGQGNRPLRASGFAEADGMDASAWLSLLIPTSPVFRVNWEYNLYVGLVPLFSAAAVLLAPRERNFRALAGLGLAGAVLAAGDRTPFLGWALHVLPGASALRLPSRYGIWLSTAILGLGALGLSRRPARPFPPLVAAFAAAVAALLWLYRFIGGNREAAEAFVGTHIAMVTLAAGLVGMWCWQPARERLRVPLVAVLALACAAGWLGAAAQESSWYSNPGLKTEDKEVRSAMGALKLFPANGAPPRISYNPADVRENAGMIQGFASYTSYSNPALDRVWAYLHLAAGIPASLVDYIQLPEAVYDKAPAFGSLSLSARFDHPARAIEAYTRADPRAYMVFEEVECPDWRGAEREMTANRDFHRRAYVEQAELPKRGPASPAPFQAAITRFEPERIAVRTTAARAGILVLSEAWYPGWRAEIDGSPAKVFPVNGWMRGTVVPAGRHDVVFRFVQRGVVPGLALTFLSAALILVLASRTAGRAGAGAAASA